MRFDKTIELIINEVVEDGLGGRTQLQKVVSTLKANIEELSVQETYKIYGEATTESMKARVLGKISVEFDNQKVFELERIERLVKIKNYANK